MSVNKHVSKGLTRQPSTPAGTPFQADVVHHGGKKHRTTQGGKGNGVPGFEGTGGGTVPTSNTPRISK